MVSGFLLVFSGPNGCTNMKTIYLVSRKENNGFVVALCAFGDKANAINYINGLEEYVCEDEDILFWTDKFGRSMWIDCINYI